MWAEGHGIIVCEQMRRIFLIAFGAIVFGICGTVPHFAFAYGYGPYWSALETRILLLIRPPVDSVASVAVILFSFWASIGACVETVVLVLPVVNRIPAGMRWVLVATVPPVFLVVLYVLSPFDRTF
jgi:hypothetical protein